MPAKFSHSIVVVFIATAILLSVQSPLLAQNASLSGVVTDSSGAIIANAAITATNQQRNLTFETASDEGGRYIFLTLPVGRIPCRPKSAASSVSSKPESNSRSTCAAF